MRKSTIALAASLASAVALAASGCAGPKAEPQPRSRIPERAPPVPIRGRDEIKPLPTEPLPDKSRKTDLPPPPFDDVPLVNQRPPEQRGFVEAYEAVGRPRIVVFVNRTLQGAIVPASGEGPVSGDSPAVTSRRPADARDPFDDSLRPGDYNEADVRGIDYESIENALTDWLAAGGHVEVVSPMSARQRLTAEQVNDLQDGRPGAIDAVTKQLAADVLIQVQVRPTRRTQRGIAVRLVAEAINVGRGGQSVARAAFDGPPPLSEQELSSSTRFVARKLMDGMTRSWQAMADGTRGAADAPVESRERAAPVDTRPLDSLQQPSRRDADPAGAVPPGDEGGLVPRDDAARNLLDGRDVGDRDAAPPQRVAPTTRPSAPPPADDAPAAPTPPEAEEPSSGNK